MLSNKLTVSLMSLITVFALAFAMSSAMAGDFSTEIMAKLTTDVTGVRSDDVSHKGGTQLDNTAQSAGITLDIKFGQVVSLVTATAQADAEIFAMGDVKVQAFSMSGGLLGAVTVAEPTAGTPADGKNFMVALSAIPTGTTKLIVIIPKGSVGAALASVGDDDDANAKGELIIDILAADPPTNTNPAVYKIALIGEPYSPITSATFQTHILLSEEPKGGFKKDHIEVSEATVASVTKLASPANRPLIPAVDRNGDGETTGTGEAEIAASTGADGGGSWRDMKVHLYLVTFNTKPGEKTVVIKVKDFAGMERPTPGAAQQMYIRDDTMLGEGRDKLTVKTNTDPGNVPLAAGSKFKVKNDRVIPAGGYLVVAENKADSYVHKPDDGDIDKSPLAHKRTPAEMMYNLIDDEDLPNLETFLSNGGTIGVMGPHPLMITEIMWGSDASLGDPGNSQWIELYNPGVEYKTQDGTNQTYLVFYGAGETPAAGLHDIVGTVDETAGYWSLAGKGQSGASGKRVTADKDVEATTLAPAIAPIISMSRVMTGGVLAKGTLASSWVQSSPPSSNFEANAPGVHIGSPGAMPVTFPEPPAPTPEPVVVPAVPGAMASDIKITEIMVDTGSGRLPQWIELTNVSGKEVSLADWSLQITNAGADADAVGASVSIDLSGTLGVGGGTNMGGTMGKSLLLVAWNHRNSANLDGISSRVVDVSSQVGQRGRYKLISDMAFMIALIPPQTTGVLTYGDTAGNLDAAAAWDIPMSENGRSSLIRVTDKGMKADGTAMSSWILASSTDLISGQATWYGSDEDAGTPGYDAGGPLPVELSHFRPARDKQTGAVVITWATQSELNNAGFFIKRSQQRDGEFKVINATMVPGAGTTSEKQFYTYTDTTAQPNVVYYYQIEDVSLDGNRQTLTRGIRLKGHIGAHGKATTLWGALKASNE